MEEVWAANTRLRADYMELRNKLVSIKSSAKKKE